MSKNPEIHGGSIFEATLEEGERVVDRYYLVVWKIFPLQGIVQLVEVDLTGQSIPMRIPEPVSLKAVRRGEWGVLKLTPVQLPCPNSLETLPDVRDKWFRGT